MADGPVANLPPGFDAYAGYVNPSGIGVTWPEVEQIPALYHLSISTNGLYSAMCADVESGAMKGWAGYDYGYCSVSNVNDLIARFGRPKKLWTSHYNPALGAHRCSPACWPGLVTTADGTQWTDHGNADWDESLLADDFFDLTPLPPPPPTQDQEDFMEGRYVWTPKTGPLVGVEQDIRIGFDPETADPGNNAYIKHGARDTALQAFKNQVIPGSFIFPQTPLMFETKDGGQLKISMLQRPIGIIRDVVIDGTCDANGVFLVGEADAP
jgi:hypothetical protein